MTGVVVSAALVAELGRPEVRDYVTRELQVGLWHRTVARLIHGTGAGGEPVGLLRAGGCGVEGAAGASPVPGGGVVGVG